MITFSSHVGSESLLLKTLRSGHLGSSPFLTVGNTEADCYSDVKCRKGKKDGNEYPSSKRGIVLLVVYIPF